MKNRAIMLIIVYFQAFHLYGSELYVPMRPGRSVSLLYSQLHRLYLQRLP